MEAKTYEELNFWLRAFANGNISLLILEGAGATGKSRAVEDALNAHDYLRVLSHVSPMSLFVLGYEFRDKIICFDDTENLIQNPDSLGLLRQFSESKEEKQIAWYSSSRRLENLETPNSYTTRSRILIVCNDFRLINKRISALATRGFHIEFKPSPSEIISKLKEVANESNGLPIEAREEIFAFLEKFGRLGRNLNLRSYHKAVGLYKESQELWKEKLMQDLGVETKLIQMSKIIETHTEDKIRVDRWKRLGYSERDFYNWKRRLQNCKTN